MQLIINGKISQIETQSATLEAILQQQGITLETRGVAIALNMQVVRKPEWATTILKEGDRIEIVQAQQGG